MRILIATDKFKGSLSAQEAARAMQAGVRRRFPDAETQLFTLSDGGEGFCRAIHLYRGTVTRRLTVTDPLGRPMEAAYEWEPANSTAWIELASASGLPLLRASEYNPLLTSTGGTGMQVLDAIRQGAEHIVLGLGGSATCDAGMGLLSALGVEFLSAGGHPLSACGASLREIHTLRFPEGLPSVQWTLATDVWNPLTGPQGAARVYAPQKGADERAVLILEEGLERLAAVTRALTGKEIGDFPGAGAAGGVAAGLSICFDARMVSGGALLMDMSGLTTALPGADWLITGEGKLDTQTLQGKLVQQVATAAKQHGVKAIACCGRLELAADDYRQAGIRQAADLVSMGIPFGCGSARQSAALEWLTADCLLHASGQSLVC